MNEVALRANDVLRNDVGLRPMMLCFRANGMKPFAWCAEILLIYPRKCDIIAKQMHHIAVGDASFDKLSIL